MANNADFLLPLGMGPTLSPQFRGITPVCYACRSYINRFTDSYDPARRVYLFRFECHGSEEIVSVDQATVEGNPDYVRRALINYLPFSKEAEETRQRQIMGYTTDGRPIAFTSSGKLAPVDRPSSQLEPFIAKMLADMAGNIGLTPAQLFASIDVQQKRYVVASTGIPIDPDTGRSIPAPKAKPEDFMIPPRKPRVIILDD